MANTYAPWTRTQNRAGRMMLEMEIALLAQLIFSVFCYGWRPAVVTVLSILSAVFCEMVANAVRHQQPTVFDGTALVTGTIIGLLMSPITPYWVPVLASAFAIIVAKVPFGGVGRNPFNPAAAGVALVTQCFPTRVFTYPDAAAGIRLPLGQLPEDLVTRLSPAAELAAGTGSNFQFSDVVWGEITGPIGATAILVLIAAAVFLFLRNTASVYITLPYLLTCAVMALLFPRGTDSQAFYSLVIELCSGYLLFAGVFMFTDPVTSPRYTPARVVYGALAGILVMILRHFGRFEEGACFAVLIMNAFAAPLDRGCWRLVRYWRKGGKRYGNPE